jgi:V-type H+-transporting ATPase subunit E
MSSEKQIAQMVEFIRQEAREKAEEIKVKTDNEFNILKLEVIEQAKIRIKEEYKRKEQDVLVQQKM